MSKKKRKGSGLAKSQTESSPEDVDAVSDDSPEVDDAATKEMVAYALGGVAGQIANSDMLLKQNLLMFVLQINPMLIAFMGIFGTLWDSITDPIMANISDNFKSRWGRRRPFILVGGLLSTIFSVVIWANFPDSDKTVKNIKEIPEIVQSENALENFGDMLRGYGITQTKLALTLDDSVAVESEKPADHIDALLKHSLKKIGAGISLVEDDSSAIPLTISTEGFGTDRLDDELMGQEFSARLTLGDRVIVDGRVLIEADYPQKRGFRERAGNFFNGRAAYMGLRFDGEQIDYRRNAYQKDGIYHRCGNRSVASSVCRFARRFGSDPRGLEEREVLQKNSRTFDAKSDRCNRRGSSNSTNNARRLERGNLLFKVRRIAYQASFVRRGIQC